MGNRPTAEKANFESLIGLVFNLLSVKVFDKNRKYENMSKISEWVWEIWLFKFRQLQIHVWAFERKQLIFS